MFGSRAGAAAIHRHRYGIDADLDADVEGPAALLGARPADPVASGSWDYAAVKLAAADVVPEVDSGVAL